MGKKQKKGANDSLLRRKMPSLHGIRVKRATPRKSLTTRAFRKRMLRSVDSGIKSVKTSKDIKMSKRKAKRKRDAMRRK
jgi:hypothetical protein